MALDSTAIDLAAKGLHIHRIRLDPMTLRHAVWAAMSLDGFMSHGLLDLTFHAPNVLLTTLLKILRTEYGCEEPAYLLRTKSNRRQRGRKHEETRESSSVSYAATQEGSGQDVSRL